MKLSRIYTVLGSAFALSLVFSQGCSVEKDEDDGTGLGGSGNVGGGQTGGLRTGGTRTGGESNAGAPTGGTGESGGEETGGTTTGAVGGEAGTPATGGSAGEATGGVDMGGAETGGTEETGGNAETGGTTTGGSVTGGTATTGGSAGEATGGTATGGEGGTPPVVGGAGGEGGGVSCVWSEAVKDPTFDCEGWADTQFGTSSCTVDEGPLAMETCLYYLPFANEAALDELLICFAGYGYERMDCNEAHNRYVNDCLASVSAQLCAVPTAATRCEAWHDGCEEVDIAACEQDVLFSVKTPEEIGACFADAGDTGEGCSDNLLGCY
ncbi:MAG: hypothetical protein JW751_25565 [Polyangiaceae bacterium]|nr:hypothetical protein [Polyangiaceae bacterium]